MTLTCFLDYNNKFSDMTVIPSIKEVCCWRLLRARYKVGLFHTSERALEKLEKSRCQTFIAGLISFNYLALYFVIIIPFILTILEVQKRQSDDGDPEACKEQDQLQTDCVVDREYKKLSALQFNLEMAIINISVLVY